MKNNPSLSEIAEALRSHGSFVIMSHLRPDGDALGCEIAMALCLKGLGKQVKVWNQDGMLDKYSFLPCADLVTLPPAEPEEFDVVVALDTGIENRLGTCVPAVKQAKLWINIDHHSSNVRAMADLVHVDYTSPATGPDSIRADAQAGKLPVDPAKSRTIFLSPSPPTPVLSNTRTPPRAPTKSRAELLKAGVNVGKAFSQQTVRDHPRRRITSLLRELLNFHAFERHR